MYYRLSTLWQSWNEQYYREHCQVPAVDLTSLTSPPLAGSKRRVSPLSSERPPKKVYKPSSQTSSATSDGFVYNTKYRILVCITCESIIQPKPTSCYTHLNLVHHITGPLCKALLERFATYDLCPFKELTIPCKRAPRIPGLKIQDGFRCNVCPSLISPAYLTINKRQMDKHLSQHNLGLTPKKAWEAGRCSKCLVQTFSLAKGRIRYFEVV
ncbi:hypothetical protein BGZ57DRAFT_914794 [Hyaloscypha finlandica]|nr:hypothetical protein BGZ57DRAFT_914794 [Hyaloscypha finlandica]